MSQSNDPSSPAQAASEAMSADSPKDAAAQKQDPIPCSKAGVPMEVLAKFQSNFEAEPKNRLAQNVATTNDLLSVCLDRRVTSQINHVFQHKIPTEGKPVTNQKSSGRCWIFACLNVLRVPFIKKFELDDFEFSQNHLFFWDKIERANYFLNAYEEVAKRREPVDGRLFQFLLASPNPVNDGGQWDMLINLINKHGVMPKKSFPESFSATASRRLNQTLNYKLRSFAVQLTALVEKGASQDKLDREKVKMMDEVYRVTSISLGSPPETFTWEYYDKSKNYKKIGPISPRQFYHEHVKPLYNMDDKICLVNDCRPDNPYGKLFTVEFLGNMHKGRKVLYNNQPISVLKKATAESIKAGEAIWFGCDVGQHFDRKLGAMNLESHDFELTLGVSRKTMDKAQRVIYGESLMTHAMVITAFTQDDDEKYVKWRVENSWGEEGGDKGYLVMTDDWFTEYVFEVVVDKKFVSDEVMAVFKQEPVVLPAWDPMGSLAKSCPSKSHL
ncbi:BLMH [Branchiostoma lanceolatum]|uniref:Bleomycin hydrolase n=1 Tax=Branchiostoma lanceolatum TaxID=7740 RepID=A0A8J9V990_BRALA|nr:BLMH [Branchiostoma lanceolatum]